MCEGKLPRVRDAIAYRQAMVAAPRKTRSISVRWPLSGLRQQDRQIFSQSRKTRIYYLGFPFPEIGMSATIEAPTRIEPCLLDETSVEILDLVARCPARRAGSACACTPFGGRPRRSRAGDELLLLEPDRGPQHGAARDRAGAGRSARRGGGAAQPPLEARAISGCSGTSTGAKPAGDLPEPASVAFIRELHRAFYADAPERC